MNEFSSRQYNENEVNRITRRALKLEQEDTISHQDLIDTAEEIGIDPQLLETAIKQEQREIKKERIQKAMSKRRKMEFYRHLGSYLIVIGALFLMNVITPGPWWFQWPALGWGIGLVFQFKAMFFAAEKGPDREIKKKHAGRSLKICKQ